MAHRMRVRVLVCGMLAAWLQATAAGATVIVPDNGSGTVDLPPGPYKGALTIIDGLPAGTTIEITALLSSAGSVEAPGGSLGGHVQDLQIELLQLQLVGTGALAGFNRSLSLQPQVITHSGPRTPGTSPQSFAQDLFQLLGQLPVGDPDFDLLRITAARTSACRAPATPR